MDTVETFEEVFIVTDERVMRDDNQSFGDDDLFRICDVEGSQGNFQFRI
jgi:hypothetical protein